MPEPRCNRRNVGKPVHGNPGGTVFLGPIAKLAVPIVSPRPDRAITLERKAMTISSGDGLDFGNRANLLGCRKMAVGHGSVAKLPLPIVAPGPDRAVSFQRDGMALPRGDCDNI